MHQLLSILPDTIKRNAASFIEVDDSAVESLFQPRKMLDFFLNELAQIALCLSPDGTITYINRYGSDILGYADGALLGENWHCLCLAEDGVGSIQPAFDKLTESGIENLDSFVNKVKRKNGELLHISWRSCVLTDKAGDANNILCYGVDITEKIAFETQQQRMCAEHLRLSSAIEQITEGVIITDVNGTIEYVNPAFCETTGYTKEEVVRENIRLLKSGEHCASEYKNLWTSLLSGKDWSGIMINKRKNGEQYHCQVNVSPIVDNTNTNGKITGYVAIQRDVTEQIKWESNMQNIQKLQAVGMLAGGIAHDFNNILTCIMGNLSFMKKYELAPDDPAQTTLENVLTASHRASNLVEMIMTFSRPHVENKQPTAIFPVLQEVGKHLKNSMKSHIELQIVNKVENDVFMGCASKLYQLVMNLCVNAMDAMEKKGGILRIELLGSPGSIGGHCKDANQNCLVLKISDQGCGMSKEVQDRIFEPFYTSKSVNRSHGGTGLGLTVALSVVEGMDGKIFCESQLGEGTTFTIAFPLLNNTNPKSSNKLPEVRQVAHSN